MRVEADRLRTLRRRHNHLVSVLEEGKLPPLSGARARIAAAIGALSWVLQELDEVPPELHSHTIKVMKESLVKYLKSEVSTNRCSLRSASIAIT
jgi:hypothetical protein